MHEKPKLQCTRDYAIFESHDHNRPLHEDPVLLSSMARIGFMPSSPIQCVRLPGGKLKVIRGHHRLNYAQRLKLPVWYVVDDSKTDIFELEGGRQSWSLMDFAVGRANSGHRDCAEMLEFRARHGLTIGVACSLFGGESAGSNNKVAQVKSGTFSKGQDLRHAYAVVDVTDFCRELNIGFATQAAFVAAVSACLRVPEFDPALFKRRLAVQPGMMRRRARRDDYLDEIEAVYNYASRTKRVPVAFRAKEIGLERKAGTVSRQKALES